MINYGRSFRQSQERKKKSQQQVIPHDYNKSLSLMIAQDALNSQFQLPLRQLMNNNLQQVQNSKNKTPEKYFKRGKNTQNCSGQKSAKRRQIQQFQLVKNSQHKHKHNHSQYIKTERLSPSFYQPNKVIVKENKLTNHSNSNINSFVKTSTKQVVTVSQGQLKILLEYYQKLKADTRGLKQEVKFLRKQSAELRFPSAVAKALL